MLQQGETMKTIIIMLFSLLLVSCGQSKDYVKKNTGNDFNFGNDSQYLSLNASRDYAIPRSNSVYTVGAYTVDQVGTSVDVVVPESIQVTSGNAGNSFSCIEFDQVICMYKGGSQFSYPLQIGTTNTVDRDLEIQKGQTYSLNHCRDQYGNILNIEANDKVIVLDSVKLRVLNGDSTVPTEVSVKIEVQ